MIKGRLENVERENRRIRDHSDGKQKVKRTTEQGNKTRNEEIIKENEKKKDKMITKLA